MITSRITQTLDIPNEPGQTATVRKLSHHQLMIAEDTRTGAVIEKASKLSGVEFADPNKDAPNDTAEERERKRLAREEAKREAEAPSNKYDRMTVLRYGVTAWTYPDGLPDGVEELDKPVAEWLFDEILAFSLRSAAEGKAFASGSLPSSELAEAVGQPS